MTAETKLLLQEEAERTRRASPWLVPRALLRDPVTLIALVIFVLILLGAAAAELFAPHDPLEQDLRMRNMPPFTPAAQEGAPLHILGTDPLGRDILSRIIFGARVSLTVGDRFAFRGPRLLLACCTSLMPAPPTGALDSPRPQRRRNPGPTRRSRLRPTAGLAGDQGRL